MSQWDLLLIGAAISQSVTQHPEMTHCVFTEAILRYRGVSWKFGVTGKRT